MRCTVQINLLFVSHTETNCAPIHMRSMCTMRAYWASLYTLQCLPLAVRVANKAKYVSTLLMYRALPSFDGSGCTLCWARSHYAAWLAPMSTLLQCAKLRLPQHRSRCKYVPEINRLGVGTSMYLLRMVLHGRYTYRLSREYARGRGKPRRSAAASSRIV